MKIENENQKLKIKTKNENKFLFSLPNTQEFEGLRKVL